MLPLHRWTVRLTSTWHLSGTTALPGTARRHGRPFCHDSLQLRRQRRPRVAASIPMRSAARDFPVATMPMDLGDRAFGAIRAASVSRRRIGAQEAGSSPWRESAFLSRLGPKSRQNPLLMPRLRSKSWQHNPSAMRLSSSPGRETPSSRQEERSCRDDDLHRGRNAQSRGSKTQSRRTIALVAARNLSVAAAIRSIATAKR